MQPKRIGKEAPNKEWTPFWVMVAKGAAHCGSGCILGDIIAEWLVFFVPGIAVWFGYRSLFADRIFATWILDYIFAFGLGIVFQYFTIAPMRGLSVGEGILAALKADTLSLTAWQFGMYGFMPVAQSSLPRRAAPNRIPAVPATQQGMRDGVRLVWPSQRGRNQDSYSATVACASST